MRKREVILAAIGLVLLLVGFAAQRACARFESIESRVVESEGCRTPVTIITPAFIQGNAILLHGLSANRRTMQVLAESMAAPGFRVFALDFAGHGDNTDAFSFQRAEECATGAVRALVAAEEIDLKYTVLVGHSMGGAIAIRMADVFETPATVAISPAPLVRFDSAFRRVLPYDLPTKRPRNLLVLSAKYDPGDLKRATQELTRSFGQMSENRATFDNGTALWWSEISAATHVSLLLDRGAGFSINYWMMQAGVLPVTGHPLTGGGVELWDSKPLPVWPRYLSLAGLLFMFPLAASMLCRVLEYERTMDISEGSGRIGIGTLRLSLAWATASLVAVLILWFWVPLRFLRIYTGDYLASFFLLSGVLLIGWHLWVTVAWWKRHFGDAGYVLIDPWAMRRPIVAGAAVGIVTLLAVGWWLNMQWTDAWMNAARWWRFAVLAPLLLPYFWAEELALDKLGEATQVRHYASPRRWGMFLLLRTIAWAAMAGALWLLDSQQILIVLMTMFFLGFSVLQRLGANAVGRRAGRAAAASFSAILAAWFIAAVFPLM